MRCRRALDRYLVGAEDGGWILQLPDCAGVEEVLARLREAQVQVQELEVMQADLEDVFVQMMRKH